MPQERQTLNYQHICASSSCDCGISRRDWLRITAMTGAAAAPLLRAGDAAAQADKGDDVPVRIGYLPITDATPLLVAHSRQLFEACTCAPKSRACSAPGRRSLKPLWQGR